jgi:two-component system response regulator FlrC
MSKATILIAEDERHTRDAISLLLENAGYKVFQTDTGGEAVAIIDRSCGTEMSIGLLILDVEMNGLTGIQVLESLRLHGDLTPAVVITGLTGTELPPRLRAPGYVEVLLKPFNPEQLANAVSRALGNGSYPKEE